MNYVGVMDNESINNSIVIWRQIMNIVKWIEKDKYIYFKMYQGLKGTYRYDLDKDKVEVLTENQDMEEGKCDYFGVSSLDCYVVFIPYQGNNFVIYNVDDGTFTYLPKNKKARYRSGASYNRCLWFFSDKSIRETAVLNIDNMRFEYPFSNCIDDCECNSYSDVCLYKNHIYICSREKDTLIKVDVINNSWEKIIIDSQCITYSTIIHYQNKFYLSGDNNYITVWGDDGVIERYSFPDDCTYNNNKAGWWNARFSDCIVLNDYILFAPLYCRSIVSLNLKTKEIKTIYSCDEGVLSWGINQFKNEAMLMLITEKGAIKEQMLLDCNNVRETQLFALPEDIDLSFLRYEYFKEELNVFINKLINS